MRNYEAVCWDLDGAILDTHDFIVESFRVTLKVCGYEDINRKDIESQMGKPLTDCYRDLTKQDDVKRFIRCHVEFQNDSLYLVKPFLGVRETLEELNEAGVISSVVTTRTKNGLTMIEKIGLKTLF